MRSWLQANLMNFLSSSWNRKIREINNRTYQLSKTIIQCHVANLALPVKRFPERARNIGHACLSPSAQLGTLCVAWSSYKNSIKKNTETLCARLSNLLIPWGTPGQCMGYHRHAGRGLRWWRLSGFVEGLQRQSHSEWPACETQMQAPSTGSFSQPPHILHGWENWKDFDQNFTVVSYMKISLHLLDSSLFSILTELYFNAIQASQGEL